MPLYIELSEDLDSCHRCLTHWQTLKDSATQLLIKYKSEALVMQSTSGWKMLLLSRCCSCQLAATLHQIECTHMLLPPKMSLAHIFLFIFVSSIYFWHPRKYCWTHISVLSYEIASTVTTKAQSPAMIDLYFWIILRTSICQMLNRKVDICHV